MIWREFNLKCLREKYTQTQTELHMKDYGNTLVFEIWYDIHVKSNQQGESNDTCFNWMRTCKANHKSKHVTYRRVAFVCVLTLFIFWHFNLNKLVE